MRPRITDRHVEALDAYVHNTEPAGALEFGNEYSGSAAIPAPYNGFAELELACPCI
jgi:hypothetical protein